MGEMVDRVAKAIGCQTGGDKCSYEETMHPEKCDYCLDHARAAIAAMRAPTEAMVQTGGIVMDGDGEYYIGEDAAKQAWQAMIDEALK